MIKDGRGNWDAVREMQLGRSEDFKAVAHSVRATELARIAGWPAVQRGGSGTGPILLSQATFLLAHLANSGPVPLSSLERYGTERWSSTELPRRRARTNCVDSQRPWLYHVWAWIWRHVPWRASGADWIASSGPTGRCRRCALRFRNAASTRAIALPIPASIPVEGTGAELFG